MLQQVEIRNFQSLGRVDIPLRLFTVITGQSSAGKSAVVRAIEMLARNARGTDYITHGQATCSVSAGDGQVIARLTRSKTRGRDAYHLATLKDGEWKAVKYTKLAGGVPEPVAGALGITELNFAGQFDMPYLLNVPGTELARTLGELTNVSMVLNAAAEANRCRKQAARDLEAARERRDALLEQAQDFAGLPGRRKAAAAAEEALARLQGAAASLTRLTALAQRLATAERVAADARAEASRREPPSLARLEDLADRLRWLEDLSRRLGVAEKAAAGFAEDAWRAENDEVAAREALHDELKALGQCPTCGTIIS